MLTIITLSDDAVAAVRIFDGRNPVTFNTPAWSLRPVHAVSA